jgi:hypothetical protein
MRPFRTPGDPPPRSQPRLTVFQPRRLVCMEWHSEPEADTNRSTIDWISKKTDEVCGELDDVLEELNPWEAIMNNVT